MVDEPQVSFIIICHSDSKDTCELIGSLQTRVHSVSCEIIVVDSVPREDEAAKTKELYSDTVTLWSESNLGFFGRNNLGIRAAKGVYTFLIDNDTYIEPDGFHCLTERLESQKNIGAISPEIRFALPPQNIRSTGLTSLSAITICDEMTGFGCPDDGTFDIPHTALYLHRAVLMVEHKVIEKIGEMLEISFLCYEKMDWCIQMTNTGYELWYEPRHTVFHKESQGTGQFSKLRTFYMTRNRLFYTHRNRKGTQWLPLVLY